MILFFDIFQRNDFIFIVSLTLQHKASNCMCVYSSYYEYSLYICMDYLRKLKTDLYIA